MSRWLGVFVLLWTSEVHATKVVVADWREQAFRADLVGIVECVTAGGIVARYRLIESWKGPAAGTELALRIPVDFWHASYPVALVGERFVVAAYAVAPAARLMSTTAAGIEPPMWWRRIPADYTLPLLQGSVRLEALELADLDEAELEALSGAALGSDSRVWAHYRRCLRPFEELGSSRRTLEGLRADFVAFLARPPEHQERELLRASVSAAIAPSGQGTEGETAGVRSLAAQASRASDVDELVGLLLRAARERRDACGWIRYLLVDAGAGLTGAALEKRAASEFAACLLYEEPGLASLLRQAFGASSEERAREQVLALRRAWHAPAPPAPPVAASGRLPPVERWRSALFGDDGFGEAFAGLVEHDPESVAQFLAARRPSGQGWVAAEVGAVLASYLGANCRRDCERLLEFLEAARDPGVRAAAAVYLYLRDPSKHRPRLVELASDPSDAGAWAALTLARHGEREYVPRALVALDPAAPREGLRLGLLALGSRVRELLSNAARASGRPQPIDPSCPDESRGSSAWQRHVSLLRWWEEHGAFVDTTDPWLPALAGQHVD